MGMEDGAAGLTLVVVDREQSHKVEVGLEGVLGDFGEELRREAGE